MTVIGDSIAMDYRPYLQEYLEGLILFSDTDGENSNSLAFHSDGCFDSKAILAFLEEQVRKGVLDADIVLLNCGLHDIKTDSKTGEKQVPILEYEKNLRKIVQIFNDLKKSLVWIRTTLFDEEKHNRARLGFFRYLSDAMEYNRVADNVMQEHNVPWIDLCTFTQHLGSNLYCDHVHFRDAVRRKQAAHIAAWLVEHFDLKKRQIPQNEEQDNAKPLNVSVVLCCHNSASRLPETLSHLLKQKVSKDLEWEVILVDNASTDNTSSLARRLWPLDASAPLRMVYEPQLGLSYARRRGLETSRYELICFVDDDNWLSPNYIQRISEIMTTHPEVGACGGRSEAVFEKDPPEWFDKYALGFVIGRQEEKNGDMTWRKGAIWGAGLVVRKAAWLQLLENGFQPLLTGRKGKKLTSGEDYELCYALRLAGWKLWYDDNLVLQHFITANRLTLRYLAQLRKGFGAQTVGFDPYVFFVSCQPQDITSFLGKIWIRKCLREIFISVFRDCSFWKQWVTRRRSRLTHRMMWLFHSGRLLELLTYHSRYDNCIKNLEHSRWIRIHRTTANFLSKHPDFADAANPIFRSTPLFSVIICNYNYGCYLKEAIDSVLAQTWKNIEIIVVDDGSTDESRAILRQYEGKIKTILQKNGGQASAFNAGVHAAKGDLIGFLDSDDVWYPNRVSQVIRKYQEAPWGLICHDLDLMDDESRPLQDTWSSFAGVQLKEGNAIFGLAENIYAWVFSPTSGMTIPSRLAHKIFPLSTESWKISADEPLAFQAASLEPFGAISEPLGAYRLHQSNLFASFHRDEVEKRIAGLTHTTRRYFFCKTIAADAGIDIPDPKTNYRFYRLCSLIARNQPHRYLGTLFKKNIAYHFQQDSNLFVNVFNIIKFLAADILIMMGRRFWKNSRYSKLKKRFDRDVKNIQQDQLDYMLYD